MRENTTANDRDVWRKARGLSGLVWTALLRLFNCEEDKWTAFTALACISPVAWPWGSLSLSLSRKHIRTQEEGVQHCALLVVFRTKCLS